MSCIICGVDGSREAGRAAAVAARLARDLGSRAVLVHVDEAPTGRSGLRIPRPHRAWRRRRLLRTTAAECRFEPGTRTRLRRGDPTSELLAAAREEDAELIVVSTGGLGTVSPALIGGTASALLRQSPCPVVAVPTRTVPPADAGSMQGVVCALERRPIDAAVVGLAADLGARLGGALHVVVNEAGVDAHDLGVDAQVHVLDVPTDEGLALVADEERAGLVVVGPVDESGSSQAVEVPVAIALAALGERPVVVLTAAAELHFGSGYYELTPAANGPGRA